MAYGKYINQMIAVAVALLHQLNCMSNQMFYLLAGHRQITLRIIPDMMIYLKTHIYLISAVGIVKMVIP